jgi:hypothetical protein
MPNNQPPIMAHTSGKNEKSGNQPCRVGSIQSRNEAERDVAWKELKAPTTDTVQRAVQTVPGLRRGGLSLPMTSASVERPTPVEFNVAFRGGGPSGERGSSRPESFFVRDSNRRLRADGWLHRCFL